ncbi:amino acid adenylation domain-containing protein [Micromonospora sp. WMMD882]|uniref:non-ribosomal peptide synthetase n=1 Tax=Micromonospora sp. WMMD882 TaxID=3015151 RepID=UPI00248B2353|nr:non-ribosomal peptide synthetase [Micromonospora sp. WMMD882]WBB79609.1 amino acid adenylation domain-containing protein [Micromonospora sp. WMMD882]
MRTGDTGSAIPVHSAAGLSYRYTAARAGIRDDGDRAAAAALAAVELVDRLGRELPVRVLSGTAALDLSDWPTALRHLPGDRARAAVRHHATPLAATAPVSVSVSVAPAVTVPAAAVAPVSVVPAVTVPAAAVAPVSVAPVSVAPVSVAPVSVAPVSVAPVSVAPALAAPAGGVDAGTADGEPGGAGPLVVLLDEEPAPELATVPVLVSATATPDGVSVVVRCAPADPWSVSVPAVAEVFAEVFAALLADPLLPSGRASAVGPATRALTLGRLAGRPVDDAPFEAIPTLIERCVDRGPDRPAVSFRDRRLTYRQLDELANGFAATLADRGVTRGDVVPVLLADGLELPVAYLAAMKLGAAFVPLDPGWPADRLRAALTVLRPRLVVVGAGPADPTGPDGFPAEPVSLDRIRPTPARPAVPIAPADLIYGIFTSGTTGTPKCAMNRHDGLANRFRFMTRWFQATGDEVVLQNSRHTFDSSVWQLFWPLTTGGRVVVPEQGGFLDVARTVDVIAAERVTITDFVPSILGLLVAMVDRDPDARRGIATLRHLIVGGEEIDPSTVHRLGELLPAIAVTNGYGPTETSIGMIFHPVVPADGDTIPIGRPIDNCFAAVVDADLRPLPPGAVGEIVVGGVCLGAGYRDAPGRTAEVFVPNPLPEIPGRRLYRTGDLGRLDPDGRLHFVGRRDFQLKVNGVRIEAGEIETAATRLAGVRQAKVIVARDGGSRSLALFVAADHALPEPVLREHLRQLLPRTSVPRHLVVLDALPLTRNGKVDRRALQARLDRTLRDRAARLADDRGGDTLPATVLAVFRAVLGDPDLTPDTDFLAVGGDSLQAVAVTTALAAEHGVPLGVQDLFEQPTPDRLAALLARRRRAPVEPEAELVERDARLPADLVVRAADPRRELRAVLVTGATGFVGSRLVHELLTGTDLRVHCLTRAADDTEATGRVVRALADRGLWTPGLADRLTGHAADLARPALGLAERAWTRLADDCDLVLNVGALVNFLFDYRAHRAANVRGAAELLALATQGRPKPLHHVSTLGVLDTEAARHRLPLSETYDPAVAVPPRSGYSRSKWVAERYLTAARRRGATVTLLRLGEVLPAADNGTPNRHALTHLLLAACHRLGMRPDAPVRSDWTPVDWAARRIVATVTDRSAWGRPMHLLHPTSVDFTELPAGGDRVPRVSCAQFLAALRDAVTDGDRDAAALLALFPTRLGTDEEQLRAVFGTLLTDNPRLFRRDGCERLERRHGLTDGDLTPSIDAYRGWLAAQERHGGDRTPLPAG